MSYDYGLTPEELLDQELMNYLYSANEYGIGPGQLQSSKDMYKGLGYQEDAISDYFKVAGIYPSDLIYTQPEPEEPGPAPVRNTDVFQSDVRAAYQNNPLAGAAFAAMETGMDPVAAANEAYTLYQQNPEKYDGHIPTYMDNGMRVMPEQAVLQMLNDVTGTYGEELSRQRREGAVADQEYEQALADYTRQQREHYAYNNPTTEFWQRGAPSFEEDLAAQRASLNPANFRGDVVDVMGAPNRKGSWNPKEMMSQIGGATRGSKGYSGFNPASVKDEIVRKLSTARDEPKQQIRGMSQAGSQMLGRMTHAKRDQEKRQVRPSGRDVDNQRRLALAQVLLGMR